MGKGDKKTRRGKIVIGSYGVRRRRRTKKSATITGKVAKTKPVKVTEQKPQKIAEEPAIVVEPLIVNEQVIANVPVEVPSVEVEIPLDVKPAKVTVKKATAKKIVKKVEKQEKPESDEIKPKVEKQEKPESGDVKPKVEKQEKTGSGEIKPKTKTKKKAAESVKEKEKPAEE